METIKVDFIKVEYNFFKPNTYKRVRFEEKYNASMLPQKDTIVFINGTKYKVIQLVYYPFGDVDGQIGVIAYLEE